MKTPDLQVESRDYKQELWIHKLKTKTANENSGNIQVESWDHKQKLWKHTNWKPGLQTKTPETQKLKTGTTNENSGLTS